MLQRIGLKLLELVDKFLGIGQILFLAGAVMSKQTLCKLGEIHGPAVEGFHVPNVSGPQVQLLILFPGFGPITAKLIEPSQEESVFGVGEVLVGQRLQDLDRPFAVLRGPLHVRYSGLQVEDPGQNP